jgi:hypothetical protein
MILVEKINPFEVLKLPASASNSAIVEAGKELFELASTEDERLTYRDAIQNLITNPAIRLEYELFEAPNVKYNNSDWERFMRIHRKNPVNLSELVNKISPPTLQDFNFEQLINSLLDGFLHVEKGNINVAVDNSPFKVGGNVPPMEVRDVLFG